jgi:LacI family transcriptional regulator
MKVITIKDIAQMANVSPSTVSRALKDHPDIGSDLKIKIKEIAAALNFKPNSFASNFRKQKSQLIGVIIPKFCNSFVPDVIDGITSFVNDKNFQVIILPTNDDLTKEKEAIQKCCDYRVDGILMSLSVETSSVDHLKIADAYNIPIVIFDKATSATNYHQVVINDRLMAENCAQQLINKKRKNIVGFFGHENLAITKNRQLGFTSILTKNNLPLTIEYASSSKEAYQKTIALIDKNNIDAVFGISDELLIGIIAAVREKQKLNEIAIIGFSDGSTIPLLFPEVSYVYHDGRKLGHEAAKTLFELLDNPLFTPVTNEMNVDLKIGLS